MQLKAALASAPVLVTPDNSKPYVVHTDASGYAVGATLSQMTERGLQPVAFMAKKMNAAQRNYPVHEWELLAVMEALKAWRCYLYGGAAPIDIFTDHHLLQWISTQPEPVGAAESVGGAAAGLLVQGAPSAWRHQRSGRRPVEASRPRVGACS